jgi:hypothetical protein
LISYHINGLFDNTKVTMTNVAIYRDLQFYGSAEYSSARIP